MMTGSALTWFMMKTSDYGNCGQDVWTLMCVLGVSHMRYERHNRMAGMEQRRTCMLQTDTYNLLACFRPTHTIIVNPISLCITR